MAEGACPSECCKFQTWDVLEDTVLYEKANGEVVVARLNKGDKVEGMTGQVHIRPIPVAVLQTPRYSKVPAGTIVFLLDHLGEGIGRVWHNGKIVELDVSGNIHEHCPFPDERCWGEYIEPTGDEQQRWGTWWVKVKAADGVAGWTKDDRNFGNVDGCA